MKLTCEKCDSVYVKPDDYEKRYEEFKDKSNSLELFYRLQLTLCDNCRRKKFENALELLPNILNTLSENETN